METKDRKVLIGISIKYSIVEKLDGFANMNRSALVNRLLEEWIAKQEGKTE